LTPPGGIPLHSVYDRTGPGVTRFPLRQDKAAADRAATELLHRQDVEATVTGKADELAKLWTAKPCASGRAYQWVNRGLANPRGAPGVLPRGNPGEASLFGKPEESTTQPG